jgi:F-type H+-transporting ATPase subunit b
MTGSGDRRRAILLTLTGTLTMVGTAQAAGGLISIDGSLFIQIGNFLLIIFLLNQFLYKPIRGILAKRKTTITGTESSIASLTQTAQEKDLAYINGIKKARADGIKQKEVMLKAVAVQEKAITEEISRKVQDELARSREKIQSDKEAIRSALLKDVDQFANLIGKKILGREMG